MKLGKILVIVKRTALARLHQERRKSAGSRRMLELMSTADDSVQGIQAAHDEHIESVKAVRKSLRTLGIPFREQTTLPARPIRGYDLVVPVGGDGTTLSVSHAVRNDTPVLGVNSAPTFSVGYLTGCTAQTFEERLEELTSKQIEPLKVQRLQVRLGKKELPAPVLNDVLFCADNPAVMTRYNLRWPDGEELQRSSGVWVSTPAGSTGALASAGGPILPLTAKQFAFLVREPYSPPGEALRFRSAVLVKDEVLTLECRIQNASIYMDGSHRVYPVPFGQTVSFTMHAEPLRLVRTLHGH